MSVRITDGSVKAHAPTHPGALVFYVGDLTLNTDIVGGAPSSLLHVLAPELSILLLDDLESRADGLVSDKLSTSMKQGVAYWKVRSRISPIGFDGSKNIPSLMDLHCLQSCRIWTCATAPATLDQTSRYAW